MVLDVCIGLASNGNNDQVNSWLEKVKKELNLINKTKFNCYVAICINGRKKMFYEDIKENFKDIDIMLLYQRTPGKNDAINKIIKYSKENKDDIIHFLDDDIKFKRGTISADLEALVQTRYNSHTLVGSNFYADVKDKKLFQKILCTPFTPNADINLFLSGNSICSWVENYPYMPATSTQIAEDSFTCVYFAKNFSDCKIIKPKNSIVYYEPAENFKDWLSQQVRTYVGVEKSFLIYPKEYLSLEYFFAWRYAENPKYRKKIRNISLNELVKLHIFRIYQKIVFIKGNYVLNHNKTVAWNKYRGED